MKIELKDLTEGQRVYATSLSRNILPFYGEVIYKKNGNWPSRNMYLITINKSGNKSTTKINTVTDLGYLYCFTTEEEAIEQWNNDIEIRINFFKEKIEEFKTKKL